MSEVARAMGASVNTVRSRLRLARAALRVRIHDDRKLSELLAA
jgi:DNA-directed RNA polymerase specialized sigma24 family protein